MISVFKDLAELYRKGIKSLGILDNTHRHLKDGDHILIPLTRRISDEEMDILDSEGVSVFSGTDRCRKVDGGGHPYRSLLEIDMPKRYYVHRTPYERMMERLLDLDFPHSLATLVPGKWERHGNILILRLDERLKPHEGSIARAFMHALKVESVYVDEAGIQGELRQPQLRRIAGNTVRAVHTENGIRYNLDVTKIMFSSGNIDERVHFSKVDAAGEVVVDMFAGIGYFTLPLAVHGNPERIYAIEKNPISYRYLLENIEDNSVGDTVVPTLGDNREVGPLNEADRVIMGYLPTARPFLPRALEFLKGSGGMLHYHYTSRKKEIGSLAEAHLGEACTEKNYEFSIVNIRNIKSYAPLVYHCVADVRVGMR